MKVSIKLFEKLKPFIYQLVKNGMLTNYSGYFMTFYSFMNNFSGLLVMFLQGVPKKIGFRNVVQFSL